MFIFLLNVVSVAFAENSVPDIIRRNGYPCEEHFTVTPDGYILSLHRIPYGKNETNHSNEKNVSKRQPVILQHGLLSSSNSWTLELTHEAPAFIMSDAGMDVWLTNVRGSTYSKNHIHLSPKSKEFWQFSWDEMAQYDLPTFIDYVLNVTQYKQLYYIGYSMGTTIFFGGMSINPSYNDKIKGMFALAPMARVTHMRSPLRLFAYFGNSIAAILEKRGRYEFFPKDSFVINSVFGFCSHFKIDKFICENFIFFTVGFDKYEFNTTWITTIEKELHSGTSIYTVLHYGQEYMSEKFQFFDFGPEINLKKYGQKKPPEYNISQVTSPVYLIWAKNDYLVDRKDVSFLIQNLPNIRYQSPVPYKKFNHMDFLWATDAKTWVYDPIIQMIKLD